MHPPLCQNTAGRFAQEHHRAALTSADSVCSNKFTLRSLKSPNPPSSCLLPPHMKTRRGRGCACTGVGA